MKTIIIFSLLGLLSLTSCSNGTRTAQVEAKDIPGFFAEEKYHYVPNDIYVPLFRDPFWFLNPRYRNSNENK